MLNKKWKMAAMCGTGIVAASALATRIGDTLVFNGKSTPVDVRMIGGSTYVKLADVARALDMTAVKHGAGQYELIQAGGANQIGGLQGKIGETLFDGKWRFTVLAVDTPAMYIMKSESEPYSSFGAYNWNRTTKLLAPAAGFSLIVIQVRVKNAVNARRTLWTAISDDRIHTALTDDSGTAHVPIGYDFEGAPTQTPYMLPGSQFTFPILFSVPQGTKVKDLVFTLKNNQTDDKPVDVRVSLAP